MGTDPGRSPASLRGPLAQLALVRPGEGRAALLAALLFFAVMLSYFPLRSLRDSLGSELGEGMQSWLFTGTLAAMLALNPLFALLASRHSPRRFIAVVLHVAAASLLAFLALFRLLEGGGGGGGGLESALIFAFFVWLSVFNLFAISLCWALYADTFALEQGKRLYGLIGLGGTLGAILGSWLAERIASPDRPLFPEPVDPLYFFAGSAAILEVAVLLVRAFVKAPLRREGSPAPPRDAAVGGTVLSGIRAVFAAPVLALVCLYILAQTVGATFLYREQQTIAAGIADRGERTAWLAEIEQWGQVLTLAVQLLLTGHLLQRLGLGACLFAHPLGAMALFAGVGWSLGRPSVFAARVLGRGLDAAVSRPAREALYTLVSRDGRYKSKTFIDTFVYRGGDALGTWLFDGGLRAGLSHSALAFLGIPVGACGVAVAWLLSRRLRKAESRADEGLAGAAGGAG